MFCVHYLFQVSSMPQSCQVSACWVWAPIRLKTRSWFLETHQGGFKSGTYVTLPWTSSTRWGDTYTVVYMYTCVLFLTLAMVVFLYTASSWPASSAAVLEGSKGNASERGSPGRDWPIFCPRSLSSRLCIAVDERWRPRGLFWARSGVEHHRARDLSEVGSML